MSHKSHPTFHMYVNAQSTGGLEDQRKGGLADGRRTGGKTPLTPIIGFLLYRKFPKQKRVSLSERGLGKTGCTLCNCERYIDIGIMAYGSIFEVIQIIKTFLK